MNHATGWLAGALILAFAASASAQQAYPSRPVRFVVPFAPGGSTDFVARAAGKKLSELLGQQFVIDNRPGAGGIVGTALVANAPPDGYTLLLGFLGPLTISPHLEKVPYDPVADFTAASLLTTSHSVLVIHPSLPVKSLKELIALAKARPGQINYATSGRGTNNFLMTELFKSRANIDIVHIPYKGTGPAAIATLSGEAQMMFGSVTGVLNHVRANRLRALVVTSAKRLQLMPEVPTLTESGLQGIDVGAWSALLAPAGTPREVIDRLNAAVLRISEASDYRQLLARQGIEPVTSTPEEFAAYAKSELSKWGEIINDSGIKPE